MGLNPAGITKEPVAGPRIDEVNLPESQREVFTPLFFVYLIVSHTGSSRALASTIFFFGRVSCMYADALPLAVEVGAAK